MLGYGVPHSFGCALELSHNTSHDLWRGTHCVTKENKRHLRGKTHADDMPQELVLVMFYPLKGLSLSLNSI